MTLQRSALHSTAAAAGSSFQERFGWELPQVYTDISSEYRAATEAAAVHDVSYIGRLKATGADTLDLLNRMSTNLILGLEPGQGAPTILTTDRGRILDLLGVVNTGEYTLLLTSPGQQQHVIEWLDKYTIMEDLTVTDITSETVMLTVFGPHSQARLKEATGVVLDQLPPYHTLLGNIAGCAARIIHRPLGELPAFDLVLPPEAAPAVWQHLTESGITPAGLEAYEAARVRCAVPLYGHEMGDAYNPLEAGLIGSVNFHKGCYIGQEVIARLDTYQKVQKRLVMLRLDPEAAVSEGASLERDGQPVGSITSLARIPTTGQLIGLGYVRTASAAIGNRLELTAPARGWAEIEALPQLFGPGEG